MEQDEKYNAVISAMSEYTYDWKPENYDDPSMPILKITKSSLGSFDWCNKKYDFSYIQRLPQDQTEAMRKGTVLHNHREDFFNDFDIKKAETMTADEVGEYITEMTPIDEYYDISLNIASFETNRYLESRAENKTEEYLPVCNEGMFDAEITIAKNINPKFPLKRDYKIHIQGIIDRIFMENGGYVPFEFKTGAWKDYKATMMRKEMAFYQLLIENAEDEVLIKNGLQPNVPVTHWGWYYPVSNYVFAQPVKTRSMTSVMNNIAKLIWAYERKQFPTKFFYKTCSFCSFFGICDAAQEDTWV
jgi:hypothetical protein